MKFNARAESYAQKDEKFIARAHGEWKKGHKVA